MQEMTHRLTEELKRLSFENHDHCIACKYAFRENDTTHLGYNSNNDPLYICNKCSPQLKETAIRYNFSPRPYEIPGADSTLWRYMDFAKYISILTTSSLYFPRADKLNDLFEGAKGLKKNKDKWDEHYFAFCKMAIKNPPEGHICTLSDHEIDQRANELLNGLESCGKQHRKHTFISCWHENTFESEAMWRLYSSFLDNAVAVKTSYQKLYISLGRNPSINIGRVKYMDLSHNYAGINDAFWRKRKSFEHEKEVRALLVDRNCNEEGKLIKCDFRLLIEEVFVSPSAKQWFINVINDVHKKFKIEARVSKSELVEEHFF